MNKHWHFIGYKPEWFSYEIELDDWIDDQILIYQITKLVDPSSEFYEHFFLHKKVSDIANDRHISRQSVYERIKQTIVYVRRRLKEMGWNL